MNEKTIASAEKILAHRQRLDHGYLECCVLAQLDDDGYPTVATISPAKIDGIRRIFFASGTGSSWTKRAEKCNRASVCFNSEEKQYNITLVGEIEILTDVNTKSEVWFDAMKAYFSDPDDPNFCILQFTTRRYSIMLNEQDGSARGTL
ncbi:hypothetical protein FACS1894217_06800 [Clostridia bacterium]|nr:hypothetical protein FACS1894217_06800 [Clostridia bacterium]